MTKQLGNVTLLTPIYSKSEIDELLSQKADISHISDYNNPHRVTGQQLGILSSKGEIVTNLVCESSIQDGSVSSAKIAIQDEKHPKDFYTITIEDGRIILRKLIIENP